MSFVTEFTTKSFSFNVLRDAADDWNIENPDRQVTAVPSHYSTEGTFGFAYAPSAFTVLQFEEYVAEEIALRAQDDETDGFPGGEAEAGWAAIRATERADVARQNREDAEYAAQQERQVWYHGVKGVWQGPDEGWIFEP